MDITAADLHRFVDHTVLKPDARREEVLRFCREAREHRFASVCTNPRWTPVVAEALAGSGVAACAVVGFPLGATPSVIKASEAAWVVAAGAREVDMVIDVGALKDGDLVAVRDDIAAVKAACGAALLKVIVETALLGDEEKVVACRLAVEAGADFVKTSTGFSSGGATVADVALMRATVGDVLGVKASGGIRSRETALAMIAAGATRIGTSAGVALVSS